jgi:chaperonin GroEL (HSP60 family)
LLIISITIAAAYSKALEDAIAVLDKIAVSIDVNDRKLLLLNFLIVIVYQDSSFLLVVLLPFQFTSFGH